MADVPKSTTVSVLCPDTGEAVPIPVCAIASDPATSWQAVLHRASAMVVRATERGVLEERFAAVRV